MPKVTFITADGESHVIEDVAGSLMEIALEFQIDGIEGACGGVCSCATCHVHVDEAWQQKVGPATEDELDLLDMEDNFDETSSRLSCQIQLTDELDGMIVRVANEG